jgi:16S rRNA (cytosine967-C5)-methyltransferase
MTPAARVAAAIEILDMIGDGLPAEQVLTRWGRNNRFAGSKDRAAIRDHVFDVMRIRRSAAWLGRAATGRGLMIGLLRSQDIDTDSYFNGEGHAPQPLMDYELDLPDSEVPAEESWNLPDWLRTRFMDGLGPEAEATAKALQERAPVTLRVNTARIDLAGAQAMLASEGVETSPNPLSTTALTVTQGARAIRNAAAYTDGYIELQDASSQAVVDTLPTGQRVLDYCAGGGGKALAIAARGARAVFAHDIDAGRMRDLPLRAARAQTDITQLEGSSLGTFGPYDIVLVDAPCSGSGSWRRAPEAKWRLTPEQLAQTLSTQDNILDNAAALVAEQGLLAYATCSVLAEENRARVDAFLVRNPDWNCHWDKSFGVTVHGDGFYTAHLTKRQ